ncbi:MAG: PH domain-containing protein [Syntrophomonas sp.]|nr:PH domain-containing protein [Syntrophomonas sp.]
MIFKARSRSNRFDWILLGFITIVTGGTGLLLYRVPDRFIFFISSFFLLSGFAFIYYSVRAIQKLNYVLDDEGLIIRYGLRPKKIKYAEIKSVENRTRMNWSRVAGNEWPGTYIGYFEEHKKGLVSAYATSREQVLIISSTQGRFAITPEDSTAFLAVLTPRLTMDNSESEVLLESRRLWQSSRGKILLFLNGLLFAAVAAFIQYNVMLGKTHIPMHYNLAGQVDRYGSAGEAYFMLLGTVIVLPIILLVGDSMTRKGVKDGDNLLLIPLFLTLFMGAIAVNMLL